MRFLGLGLASIVLLGGAASLNASCTLEKNCGFCNSGSFTIRCQCTDSSSYVCTRCDGTGCPGSPGCCCGHTTTVPIVSHCTSVSCAGSAECIATRLPLGRAFPLIASSSPGLARVALPVLVRVQEPDYPASGVIVSANAPIEVNVPPESHLAISDVDVVADSQRVSGATFAIRNDAAANLIAYSAVLNLYWDIDAEHPLQQRVTQDGWFLGQYVLQPGQSKTGALTTSASPNKPMRLTRVVLALDYAEFADGTVFQTPGASSVREKLAASRKAKAAVQAKYAAEIRSGQSPESVAGNIQANLKSAPGQPALRMGLSELLAFLKLEGPQGLANRLLTPPPALPR